MLGFLKTILIIYVVYYIFKFVMRLAAPHLAKKMMEKAAGNFNEQFNNPYYKEKPQTKEGETYIEKQPTNPTKVKPTKKDEGEYVDFEEID